MTSDEQPQVTLSPGTNRALGGFLITVWTILGCAAFVVVLWVWDCIFNR